MTESGSPLVFFSQADAQLERAVKKGQFYWDLITRLLLGPGVVIPDIFFLISNYIDGDVRDGRSWILNAVGRGIVVPAFRSNDLTFKSIHRQIVEEENIAGVLPTAGATSQLLARVETDVKLSWNEDMRMGVRYHERVVEQIGQDTVDLSGANEADRILWAETQRLRFDSLDRARELSPNIDHDGVRRGDLLRALAEFARFDGDHVDVRGMLDSIRSRSERRRYAAVALWINEVYHQNQADGLSEVANRGVRPSFPVTGQPGSSVLAKDLILEREASATAGGQSGDGAREVSVRWPSLRTLMAAGPDAAFGVRDHEDFGQPYLEALREFQLVKSDTNWQVLAVQLEKYAEELCRVTGEKAPNRLFATMKRAENLTPAIVDFGSHFLPDERAEIATAAGGLLWHLAIVAADYRPKNTKLRATDSISDVQFDAPALGKRL